MSRKTPLIVKYRLWPLWLLLMVLLGTTFLVACDRASTPSSSTSPSSAGTPSSTPSTSAKKVQVKVIEQNGQYTFTPAKLTIAKGTKVTWTNASDAPHTVTSDTNAFATSSNLEQNQTFSMTFNTAGTYAYHCAIHSYMKATITVTS